MVRRQAGGLYWVESYLEAGTIFEPFSKIFLKVL